MSDDKALLQIARFMYTNDLTFAQLIKKLSLTTSTSVNTFIQEIISKLGIDRKFAYALHARSDLFPN